MVYRVYEDNAGGLHLFVMNGDDIVYSHSGYEFSPGTLKEDIETLKSGSDPNYWDGNEFDEDPLSSRELLRDLQEEDFTGNGACLICDGYPGRWEHLDFQHMGEAGLAEFSNFR